MKKYSFIFCILFAFTSQANSDPTCEKADKSFSIFLTRFGENKQFQKSRYVLPLVVRYGVYNNPAASEISVSLLGMPEIENLGYTVFRSASERKTEYIKQQILLKTNRYVEVYHELPDADSDRELFKFRNISGCWYLEEVHNKSL